MDDLAKRRLPVFYEEYARYCKALRDDLQSLLEAISAEPNPRFDMVSVKVFMDNYINNLDASEDNYIKNMVENEIYNYTFCEDYDTVIEILLNSGGCSKAAFDEAWEAVDKIIIDDNLTLECPKYNCMLSKMIDGALGTSFICTLISEFEGHGGENNGFGYHLHIQPDDFTLDNLLKDNANAGTFTLQGRPIISINSDKCNEQTSIDIFETLQHELIHAKIYQDAFNLGWDGNINSFDEVFLFL